MPTKPKHSRKQRELDREEALVYLAHLEDLCSGDNKSALRDALLARVATTPNLLAALIDVSYAIRAMRADLKSAEDRSKRLADLQIEFDSYRRGVQDAAGRSEGC